MLVGSGRRLPRYKALDSRPSSSQVRAASVSRRCRRSRSRSCSIQPRSRGQAVIRASWARSTVSGVEGDQPGAGSRSRTAAVSVGSPDVESAAGGRPPGVRGAVSWGDQAQQDAAGEVGLCRGEAGVDVLGGVGDGSRAARRSPRRRPGSGRGPCGGARSPAGRGTSVAARRARRSTSSRIRRSGRVPRSARRRAGRTIASRSSSRLIGPTSSRLLQRGGKGGVFGAAAEEVGAYGDDDPQAAAGAVAARRQSMKRSRSAGSAQRCRPPRTGLRPATCRRRRPGHQALS